MKRWGLRILSAILTFTLGTEAAIIGWRCLKPVAIQPVRVVPGINSPIPTPPTADNNQLIDKAVETIKPHLVSISPYEIKHLIDENRRASQSNADKLDLVPIWRELGIKPSETNFFPNCTGLCQADIFRLELDGKAGKETLLRLSDNGGIGYLYLIFNQEKRLGADAIWDLLGYFDSYGRYWEPPQRLEIARTKRWLVVGRMIGSGSGFGSYADTWYEISERGIVPVLSYQTSLFIGAGGNPMMDRKTKVVSVDYRNGRVIVILRLSASYSSEGKYNDDLHLWSTSRRAIFVKELGGEKFTFDATHSEILEKELNPRFGDGVFITDEEILKYNYRELAQIATGKDAKRKDWLRDFLLSRDDSREKQSLQEALEGAQP